jgi:hypothetical protein
MNGGQPTSEGRLIPTNSGDEASLSARYFTACSMRSRLGSLDWFGS